MGRERQGHRDAEGPATSESPPPLNPTGTQVQVERSIGGGGFADTGISGDIGTRRREQGQAAEAGGWWVRATQRWAELHIRRG